MDSLAWQLSLKMGEEGAPRAPRVSLIDVVNRILYLLNNGLGFSPDLGSASVLTGNQLELNFHPQPWDIHGLSPPGPPRDQAAVPLQ